jgi:hypothetical protein
MNVKIIPFTLDYASFILDSWCDSYRHSPTVKHIDPKLYKIEMRNRVYNLIPKCKVLVATDPDNENPQTNLRGWIAAEAPREPNGLWLLHYVLVKYDLQGKGIASLLAAPFRKQSPDGMMFATHYTLGLRRFGRNWLIPNDFLLDGALPAKRNEIKGTYDV